MHHERPLPPAPRIDRAYLRELGAAMGIYAITVMASAWIGNRLPPGPLQALVYLTPSLPVVFAIIAIVRQIEGWRHG